MTLVSPYGTYRASAQEETASADDPRHSSSEVPTVRFEREQSVTNSVVRLAQNDDCVFLTDSRNDAEREPADDLPFATSVRFDGALASKAKAANGRPHHKDCHDNRAVQADELRLVLTPHTKEKRAALPCLKEDVAMKKPTPSRSISDLVGLVDSMIAYWKAIAESNFKKANPNSDLAEFERMWPQVLNNFFLAETVRMAKLLGEFRPEGRDN